MKLGVSGQALSDVADLEGIIKVLKKYQISNIEIWPENIAYPSGKNGPAYAYKGKDINSAKRMLVENGIHTACVTFGGAAIKELVGDVELYATALTETVRVAKLLGAGIVNHYCCCISMGETPDLERIKRYMKPALIEAEKLGIVLALENEAHDSTATPENMLKIVSFMNSDYFKTNFDATNYYHASQEGFPHAYEVLKDYIAYVHVKNGCLYDARFYDSCGKGSEMSGMLKGRAIYYPPVSQGAVNIDGLMIRLKQDGYKGYCTLEPHISTDKVESYYAQETAYLNNRKYFD